MLLNENMTNDMVTISTEKNIQLFVDEDQARKFCRDFLLPYNKPHLFQLAARKKYSNGQLQQGAIQLERQILSFDQDDLSEESFIRQLRKMDILASAGIYTVQKRSKTCPKQQTILPEWMVMYITAYPLDEEDAADAFIQHVMTQRRDHRRAIVKDHSLIEASPITKVSSYMKTCLHKSPCRQNRMLKLDIDTKEPGKLQRLYTAMLDCNVLVAVETHGGYHVVIERGASCQGLWKFTKIENSSIPKSDKSQQWITIEDGNGPLLAIPGTRQGGFIVRLVTDEWKDSISRINL